MLLIKVNVPFVTVSKVALPVMVPRLYVETSNVALPVIDNVFVLVPVNMTPVVLARPVSPVESILEGDVQMLVLTTGAVLPINTA
jgi:hypothetical protein